MGLRSEHGSVALHDEQVGDFSCLVGGTGAPLVILAGLYPETGVAGKSLRRLHEESIRFWARDHEVVYFNRRASMPLGISFSALAAEHADAIRERFERPVDVLGMSTGGSIAQQLAAEHPDVVDHLVLVSSGARLNDLAKLDQRRVAARLRAGATRQAGAVMAAALSPYRTVGVVSGIAGWLTTPRLFSAEGLSDMATTIEAEDTFDLADLPEIQAPTLIIGGGRDRFYPRELLEETAALIPRSKLELVSGAGHVDVLTKPPVLAAISRFLAIGPSTRDESASDADALDNRPISSTAAV